MILVLSHTYLKWKFSYFKYQQLHIYLIPLGNVCMILNLRNSSGGSLCAFAYSTQQAKPCTCVRSAVWFLKSPLIFCNQDHGSFHCLSRADIFLDGKSCPRWWIIEQHFPSAHHVMSSAHVLPHLLPGVCSNNALYNYQLSATSNQPAHCTKCEHY